MRIGDAGDGDVVALNGVPLRIMITGKGAIGCREVLQGTSPPFVLSDLHRFLSRDVEVDVLWKNPRHSEMIQRLTEMVNSGRGQ